ncbi:NUDIX hydrolase [Agromyces silvae]|uniref:NUDIX hydrolase n=1 Tax=Agromyces silvae TaxID=3388266 RepID=UPI00280BACA2|nr:NUDIX hydrolase [Agromyces protaetiae]
MDRDGAVAPPALEPAYAATVVMLRDGERGVEVLLAQRPESSRSFAGAWVFPGGVVETDDLVDGASGELTARRTAVRETREEIGLVVDPEELVPFSRWTPPTGSPKTLITTFFAVRVPDGDLRPEPDEVADLAWMRPSDALARHARGGMTLWPPTWVTLHGLDAAVSVEAVLAAFRTGVVRAYVSRFSDDRRTVVWQEDGEYAPADAVMDAATAARHRLVMERLPWVYLSDF